MIRVNNYTGPWSLFAITPGEQSPMHDHPFGEIAADDETKAFFVHESYLRTQGLDSITKACKLYPVCPECEGVRDPDVAEDCAYCAPAPDHWPLIPGPVGVDPRDDGWSGNAELQREIRNPDNPLNVAAAHIQGHRDQEKVGIITCCDCGEETPQLDALEDRAIFYNPKTDGSIGFVGLMSTKQLQGFSFRCECCQEDREEKSQS